VPKSRLSSFDLTREGFEAHRDWERTLNGGKWGMVNWPEAYGGSALDLIRWLIFEEEYHRVGAPTRVNQNGIFLLGPTMMEFGTDDHKARLLPRMAAGADIWAQAWSEPGAGSDLAAVRSTCTLDGDHYILNGQTIRITANGAWPVCDLPVRMRDALGQRSRRLAGNHAKPDARAGVGHLSLLPQPVRHGGWPDHRCALYLWLFRG
jgi:alkylation response protein AidB-like acyl-CoA dehydrogenase